ncbi:response regulator [Sphingomonas sp. S1-29]|uniref:response regulator n=1 Tax=Sphingomonas sp. S1-29 TaxID=2991074 RepID=UPI00223F3A60|nr:response regulator [Sphingomonas sp. S1-29]UZK70335.1 response regulator [Sphingomonas sp. S1-29]
MLDAMMPMLTGFEVLARLKHDPGTAGLPVIMLTARRSEDGVAAALRGGAADYLTKPFVPEELLMRVETALAQSRMPGQPGS